MEPHRSHKRSVQQQKLPKIRRSTTPASISTLKDAPQTAPSFQNQRLRYHRDAPVVRPCPNEVGAVLPGVLALSLELVVHPVTIVAASPQKVERSCGAAKKAVSTIPSCDTTTSIEDGVEKNTHRAHSSCRRPTLPRTHSPRACRRPRHSAEPSSQSLQHPRPPQPHARVGSRRSPLPPTAPRIRQGLVSETRFQGATLQRERLPS